MSDSRISGGRVLTDQGAKIFEIPVSVCVLPNDQSSDRRIEKNKFTYTVGFAFTGSALIALQTYAAAASLWPKLATYNQSSVPDLSALASHISTFLRQYANDVYSCNSGETTCILMGKSKENPSGEAIQLTVKSFGGKLEFESNPLLLDDGKFEVFGLERNTIKQHLSELLTQIDHDYHMLPRDLMRHYLNVEMSKGIGGGIQLGYLSDYGFQLCCDIEKISFDNDGIKTGKVQFRGFDFDMVRYIEPEFQVVIPSTLIPAVELKADDA